MKTITLTVIVLLAITAIPSQCVFAQKDIIYKNDSSLIRCRLLKVTHDQYEYAFVDSSGKMFKTKIFISMVDSIHYNFYDSDLVQNNVFTKKQKPLQNSGINLPKNLIISFAAGVNAGNFLEFNSISGTDKKSISGTISIDAGLNYHNDSTRVAMTNELHWIFGMQKSGLTSADRFQRVNDDFNTLHDFSIAVGKTKKWNINMIVKTSTGIFTIYNGDYFKDYNNLGQSQGFLSPYSVTVAPGIKWSPNQFLRLSISPYSFNVYGVQNQQVSGKGVFISEMDESGKYKKSLFKRLGAEVNIWYDRQIKSWLTMQYRLGISSDYFERIARNGTLDGLFITNIKLFKNINLTHRAEINGKISLTNFRPYIGQTILLSYVTNF